MTEAPKLDCVLLEADADKVYWVKLADRAPDDGETEILLEFKVDVCRPDERDVAIVVGKEATAVPLDLKVGELD